MYCHWKIKSFCFHRYI